MHLFLFLRVSYRFLYLISITITVSSQRALTLLCRLKTSLRSYYYSYVVEFVRLHWSSCISISTWRCEPAALMARWVHDMGEDKAAFMTYSGRRLHTLRGSIYLLISNQGIWALLIPCGIYLSRQELSGEEACAVKVLLTKLKHSYLRISLAEIAYRG